MNQKNTVVILLINRIKFLIHPLELMVSRAAQVTVILRPCCVRGRLLRLMIVGLTVSLVQELTVKRPLLTRLIVFRLVLAGKITVL